MESHDVEEYESPMTIVPSPSDEKEQPLELARNETHEQHLYEGYADIHLAPLGSRSQLSLDGQLAIPGLTRSRSTYSHRAMKVKTGSDVIVDFDSPEDLLRPMNWTYKKKLYTTIVYGFITMGSTWGSSIYTSAIPEISNEFGVAQVVSTIGATLYMFGFGTGPLLWAPLSEIYGRKPAVLILYFVSICFAFGSAVAKDFQLS